MPSQLLLVLLALCTCCATLAPPQLDRAIARLQRFNDAYLSELEELVGEVGQVESERSAVLAGPCKSMTPCCHVAMLPVLRCIAIPTVSSLPQHWPDIAKAAGWLVQRLERAGLVSAVAKDHRPHDPNSSCRLQ